VNSDEEGYVHRPGDAVDGSDGDTVDAGRVGDDPEVDHRSDGDAADAAVDGGASLPGPQPTGFGERGWVLVATVVLAFLVIPGIIYLRPALPGEAGLSFVVAMLILPLVPAVLLGLTAVWSMRASRRR
jgi:hypothetical protein